MHDEGWDVGEGIPGHASFSEPLKRLQVFLRDNGFVFEAEGDVTRIHVEGAIVEVRDEPGVGLAILASLPLPYGGGDAEYYAEAARVFTSILAMLGRPVSYEVDASLGEYPMLRARVLFGDVEELVESLVNALSRLKSGALK